ncbi:MAG: hypothetical protein KAR00_02985 [Candidatus Pacebacteria bacterium]|nr:hypothetical protein [Candidatus Paceibacterota bacterium]
MRYFLLLISFLFPLMAFAQPQDFSGFVGIVIGIINLALPAAVAYALFLFVWGLAKFLSRGGSEESVEEGKKLMLWGIIGLFVILSAWALASIIAGSFDFQFGVPLAPRF